MEEQNKELKRQLDERDREALDNFKQTADVHFNSLKQSIQDQRERDEIDRKLHIIHSEDQRAPFRTAAQAEQAYAREFGPTTFAASLRTMNTYLPPSQMESSLKIINSHNPTESASKPYNQHPQHTQQYQPQWYDQFQQQQAQNDMPLHYQEGGGQNIMRDTQHYLEAPPTHQQQRLPPLKRKEKNSFFADLAKSLAKPNAPRTQTSAYSSSAQAMNSRQPGQTAMDYYAAQQQQQYMQQPQYAPPPPPQLTPSQMKASKFMQKTDVRQWNQQMCVDPLRADGIVPELVSPYSLQGSILYEYEHADQFVPGGQSSNKIQAIDRERARLFKQHGEAAYGARGISAYNYQE